MPLELCLESQFLKEVQWEIIHVGILSSLHYTIDEKAYTSEFSCTEMCLKMVDAPLPLLILCFSKCDP